MELLSVKTVDGVDIVVLEQEIAPAQTKTIEVPYTSLAAHVTAIDTSVTALQAEKTVYEGLITAADALLNP